MTRLTAQHITCTFPGGAGTVLNDVSFCVQPGELFVVAGKSGCGKSTLLRILGGFDAPDAGGVLLDDAPVCAPQHNTMMMFQSFDQMFPWYTLEQNIIFALRKSGVEKNHAAARERAVCYLHKTGLTGFESAYPHTLSGGMLQRGALARALCLAPRVLLMDEPFSSLDPVTRCAMQDLLLALKQETDAAVVLVTHDIDEALRLADTVSVLRCGIKGLQQSEKTAQALKALLV